MAEYRFQPDPDFELTVTRAAMGGASATVRAARRRRTTLLNVGDQIIEEAKRIANAELPSRNPNGGRNIGYDFAAPDRTGKTYVQSFGMRVEKRNGRLVLIIFNNHEHAQDVEFGNHPSGQARLVRRKRGYFTLPLSAAGVARNRAIQNSPEAKERARNRARLSYARRSIDKNELAERFGREFREIKARLDNNRTKSGIKTKAFAAAERDARDFVKRRNRALARLAGTEARAAAARAALGRKRSQAFVKVNPTTGQPSLYTKEFRTYRGYAILRQATRRVTIRTLE